jgi:glycosyltransferase involved in cell wall biosynthesis
MKPRLVILTEIIAPYRIPVFNALAARSDIDPHVIFLSETDPSLRQWHVDKQAIRFSFEVLPSTRVRVGRHNLLLNRGVRAALRRARPDVILCGGYNYPASWSAAYWARRKNIPLLLWSESTALDARNLRGPVEWLKRRFRNLSTAFLVPGISARDYLLALRVPAAKVFFAPNAVDVEFYSARAAQARASADAVRSRFNLPQRYFLYFGRLVREKGVFDLLDAYSALDDHSRSQIGLVFVGDGVAREELRKQAARFGSVRFTGFLQKEEAPAVYALAEALVLPTHSDTWGLVVNEAMACGLPVMVSQVAGCAADLVIEGQTGFLFPAHDGQGLLSILRNFIASPDLKNTMTSSIHQHIRGYTPSVWAEGAARAVHSVLEARR